MTLLLYRSLALSAVAALMLGQLAVGHAGVLGGALAAGFVMHGHEHRVSLLSDGDHVDVVLHHEDEAHEEGSPGLGPRPIVPGAHPNDHVVHASGAETSHRGSPTAPALSAALRLADGAIARVATAALSTRPLLADACKAPACLRSTVLRI